MNLAGRVLAFAERHGLWTAGTPVIAAVSGGADSVALLLILHDLACREHLHLAGVAHLQHHIRGDAADEDAAFVSRLAGRLSLPLELAHDDVPARAQRTGESLEVGGRHARLAFYQESLEFMKRGYRMMIACQLESKIFNAAGGKGIPVIALRMKASIDLPASMNCVRTIKENRIDLVHTHSSTDSWVCSPAPRWSGVPVVRSRHVRLP